MVYLEDIRPSQQVKKLSGFLKPKVHHPRIIPELISSLIPNRRAFLEKQEVV
jgi:hypothetical protein